MRFTLLLLLTFISVAAVWGAGCYHITKNGTVADGIKATEEQDEEAEKAAKDARDRLALQFFIENFDGHLFYQQCHIAEVRSGPSSTRICGCLTNRVHEAIREGTVPDDPDIFGLWLVEQKNQCIDKDLRGT